MAGGPYRSSSRRVSQMMPRPSATGRTIFRCDSPAWREYCPAFSDRDSSFKPDDPARTSTARDRHAAITPMICEAVEDDVHSSADHSQGEPWRAFRLFRFACQFQRRGGRFVDESPIDVERGRRGPARRRSGLLDSSAGGSAHPTSSGFRAGAWRNWSSSPKRRSWATLSHAPEEGLRDTSRPKR